MQTKIRLINLQSLTFLSIWYHSPKRIPWGQGLPGGCLLVFFSQKNTLYTKPQRMSSR